MCPLRYILLLLSLLIALIGFAQAMTEDEVSMIHEDEEEITEKKKHGSKPITQTLISMLSGRYLYEVWKSGRIRA